MKGTEATEYSPRLQNTMPNSTAASGWNSAFTAGRVDFVCKSVHVCPNITTVTDKWQPQDTSCPNRSIFFIIFFSKPSPLRPHRGKFPPNEGDSAKQKA